MFTPSLIVSSFTLIIVLIDRCHVYGIPACVIIDTDMIQRSQKEPSNPLNNQTASVILRNLRVLEQSHSSTQLDTAVEPVPLSYIDVKQTPSSTPPISINSMSLKKSLSDVVHDVTFAACSLDMLSDIETQMVVPFEFRRLRIEQPDRYSKFLEDDPRETVPDLSTAVYERRSDPDGIRFCRSCRDGLWTQLTVCDTVRCDAEALRANPRLVTEWGEIKPLDGGALYAPSTVYAIYAFAFGPHCKQCESNGQWSRYALPELCSGIKFFGHHPSSTMNGLFPTVSSPSATTTKTTSKLTPAPGQLKSTSKNPSVNKSNKIKTNTPTTTSNNKKL